MRIDAAEPDGVERRIRGWVDKGDLDGAVDGADVVEISERILDVCSGRSDRERHRRRVVERQRECAARGVQHRDDLNFVEGIAFRERCVAGVDDEEKEEGQGRLKRGHFVELWRRARWEKRRGEMQW